MAIVLIVDDEATVLPASGTNFGEDRVRAIADAGWKAATNGAATVTVASVIAALIAETAAQVTDSGITAPALTDEQYTEALAALVAVDPSPDES